MSLQGYINQEEQFSNTSTIAGNWEYHQFEPIDANRIHASRVSGESTSIIANVSKWHEKEHSYQHANVWSSDSDNVAYMYDIIGGLATHEISIEQCDTLVNFMYPHGPKNSSSWPLNRDTC